MIANTRHITRNSNVAGLKPAPAELLPAELAINIADGKLYTNNGASVVVQISIPLSQLKDIVSASVDFADFKTRVNAL